MLKSRHALTASRRSC